MTDLFEKTFSNRKDLNKAQIISELKRIIAKLEKEPSYPDMHIYELIDASAIDDLELSFLWLYLQTCYAQEHRNLERQTALYRDVDEKIFDAYPCHTYHSEKFRLLLVDTPVILGSYRTYASRVKENLVKDLVLLSVRRFLSVSGKGSGELVGVPFAVCLYRKCLEDQTSATTPDIDNIETRKIINTLVRELDLEDSFHSLITSVNSIEFVQDKNRTGTSILLISEEKRLAFEKEFISRNRSLDFIRCT